MIEDTIASINYKLISNYVWEDFPLTKWQWDANSGEIIFKDSFFQELFFGQEETNLSLHKLAGAIKKEDQLKVLLLFIPENYEKESYKFIRFRIENKNYNYHLIECFSQIEQINGETIIKGFFRDITKVVSKIKELEDLKDQISEREKLFPVGYWEMDPASKTLRWSKELYDIYGLKEGSLKPTSLFFLNKIVHPQDVELVKEKLQLFYKKRKPFNLNYRIIRSDGSLRNIRAKASIMENSKGDFVKFMGASVDITED